MTTRKSSNARKTTQTPSNLKLQRWIDLIAALLSRRYGTPLSTLRRDVPAYDPAKDDAAVARMFERDKDELRAFGIPIEMLKNSAGEELGYSIDARELYLPFLSLASAGAPAARRPGKSGYHALPTLVFEPDEMSAVIIGATHARALGDAALTADVDSALRKLTFDLALGSALPAHDGRSRADHGDHDPDALRTLGEAMLRRKRASFSYRTIGRDDAIGERTVEPYGLFFHNSRWYLAARDCGRGDVRNFRVSRMAGIAVNETKAHSVDFAVPATFKLDAHASAREPWELGDGAAEAMVLEFRGESGAVLAAQKLGAATRGSPRRRTFQVKRRDAFIRWIISFAGEIVPVSPASLVEEYRSAVLATLALYTEAAR